MHSMRASLFVYVFVFYTLRANAASSRATRTAVSTFIYPTDNGNLTFALSAVTTGDVYMHLSAPAIYQWVGVGTGSEMDGSVMLVLYQNADKRSIILSTRLSDDHTEPRFNNEINCVLENSTVYHNSNDQTGNMRYYSADIHCKNITALGRGDGKLDFAKPKQPFLYAWGPSDGSFSSASKSASMKRHEAYGNFWMDMTMATSADVDAVFFPNGTSLSSMVNAGADGQVQSDGDKVGPAHAAIMLATFVIIFPLGAVLLRFLENIKAHYITQTIGVLANIIGVGLGIYLSRMYNHSRDISSAHQVFGLILVAFLVAQWAVGLYHHLQYRKYRGSTVYGKTHVFAGPIIVLGGIINGFTGFDFSSEPHSNVYYGAAVAVVAVIVLVSLGWKRWSKARLNRGRRISNAEELDQDSYRMNLVQGDM